MHARVCKHLKKHWCDRLPRSLWFNVTYMELKLSWNLSRFSIQIARILSSPRVFIMALFWKEHLILRRSRISRREKTLQLCGIMSQSYHNVPNYTGQCRGLGLVRERAMYQWLFIYVPTVDWTPGLLTTNSTVVFCLDCASLVFSFCH